MEEIKSLILPAKPWANIQYPILVGGVFERWSTIRKDYIIREKRYKYTTEDGTWFGSIEDAKDSIGVGDDGIIRI